MVDSTPTESLGSGSESQLDYRPMERWAYVCLILGFLSPLASIAPVLWLLPILGLVAGGVALGNIRRDPGRPGRALALAGLALSTLFIVLPVVRIVSARLLLAEQARPVADQFLEYLRQRSPEKALMLSWVPDFRRPMDEDRWLFFRSDDEARAELRKFVSQPAVRMLLALGEKAQVSFYKTAGAGTSGKVAQVDYWYAVTFTDDDAKKKTLFFGVLLERRPSTDPDLNPWRVRNFVAGIDPARR